MSVPQPSGTVTLVFTDIEGSTRLLEELGVDAYRDALAEHRRVVRDACARNQGFEVDYEGDAFFYAFASAQAAVAAVSEAMVGLATGPIRIRVGIHTGEPGLDPPKYVGLDVHRAARIMSAAHGGQVVLSPSTVALLEPGSIELAVLGAHRLKDLTAPISLHQLVLDGLPAEFPPLKTLYRSNLPVPATPFLGREAELHQVVQRLTHPDTRLLTLTGPGGTGKTRLALQAAAETADDYPDGITWVALAPLRDPGLLLSTIAQALDLKEHAGEDLADTLATVLGGKQTLLLLDNLEHLLPEAATVLAGLIDACPALTVLATSRERLQIAAETASPVPPMSATDGERLFLERARAAGIEIHPDATVSELCRRLDELPLALELAAARTTVFTPAQLLDRIGQRLDLLKGGRDADPRQQTLRATIEWSYQLLDPAEQTVYRALSVFAGGCTYTAAERVAAADPDTLQSLLEKSLLRRRDEKGTPRYSMLETIREHAADTLTASAEDEPVFDAFLQWLGLVVGEVDELWLDRDQIEWFDTLEADRANLLGAIAACRTAGRHLDAMKLLLGAFEFFDARGPYEPLLTTTEGVHLEDERLQGRVHLARGVFLNRLGRLDDSWLELEIAYALGVSIDDYLLATLARHFLVLKQLYRGAIDVAKDMAREALGLARSSGDPNALAAALNMLGQVADTGGDAGRAEPQYAAALEAYAAAGNTRGMTIIRLNSVGASLSAGVPRDVIEPLNIIVEDARRLGDAGLVGVSWGLRAITEVALGDCEAARASVAKEIEAATHVGERALLAEAVMVLALVAARENVPERAAVLWAAGIFANTALGIHEVEPELRPYITELLEPLRARDDFADLWQTGSALSVDEALELGLLPAT